MKRIAFWLGIALLSLGCAKAAAPLTWASDSEANVPFTFHDPQNLDHLEGFEYDIVQALGDYLHRPTQFVQNDWDGLVPGLKRGMYDMVIDGIEISAARDEAVLFSRPYFVSGERLVVRRNGPKPRALKDLSGLRVGTIKQTLAERLLEKEPGVHVRAYQQETNAFYDLKNGRLDAILVDTPIALYYGAIDDALELSGPSLAQTRYAIAFNPGNLALKKAVDDALDAMVRDGTMRRILARWNLWTPEMVAFTADHCFSSVPADKWQAYRQAMRENDGSWSRHIARYVGFLPLVLHGAWLTLAVSAAAMVLAVALGLVLALLRHYGGFFARKLAGVYIEVVRGTPLLIQVLFIYYGLPSVGVRLSPFVAGVIALGLNYAAYEAENYRAGLLSVSNGQMEAALALNMTHAQALRLVVVPQAFRTVVPVMTNDFISLLKDSSLISLITLSELSQTYIRLSSTYFDYAGVGVLIGGAYLLLGLPFVRLARYAERHLGRGMARERRGHP